MGGHVQKDNMSAFVFYCVESSILHMDIQQHRKEN